MGVMIILGSAIVGYTIVQRMGGASGVGNETGAEPASPQVSSQDSPQESPMSFGEVMAKLPADAVVEEMVGEGNRLMVRIRTPDEAQSILIFNLQTGRRLGVIRLTQ